MSKKDNLKDFLTSLASKIRSLLGSSESINPQDFEGKLDEIYRAGLENGEGNAPTLQSKSVTPSEFAQVILPDEGYEGLAQVTVLAVTPDIDPDIVSSNIKSGVSILGVNGSLTANAASESIYHMPFTLSLTHS